VLCAFANGPHSSLVNTLAGDPCRIGGEAHHLPGALSVGLVGAVLLWWALLPAGLGAAAVATLASRRRHA
jgi:hypothetical protein